MTTNFEVNGQQFGPYCGFASRFQYEQDDEVDGFDILDHRKRCRQFLILCVGLNTTAHSPQKKLITFK